MSNNSKDEQLKGFMFFKSYYEAISLFEPVEQLELYNAIFEYMLYDEEPEISNRYALAAWLSIKPNLDNTRRNITNGTKGGRASGKIRRKKAKAKQKASANEGDFGDASEGTFTSNNEGGFDNKTKGASQETVKGASEKKRTYKEKEKDKEKDKDKDNNNTTENAQNTSAQSVVLLFGQFKNVKLTQIQQDELYKRINKKDANDLIEQLSEYMENGHGNKYENHYLTLLSWARRKGLLIEQQKQKKAEKSNIPDYSIVPEGFEVW